MVEPSDEGDLSPDLLREHGAALIEWIASYLEDTRDLPVLSRSRPGDLLAALPDRGPEDAVPLPELLAQIERLILPGITHWNHPRFFAYFANTGSIPGILGAALGAALNPNGMLWRTSPAATELEQRTLAWLAAWLGLPGDLFGIINDTASVSTLCALAAARQAVPGYRRSEGMASLDRPLRLYASEQAHSSIEKAALILGLGQSAARKVATTADYAMDPDALAAALRADEAMGARPFAVIATAGTTSTTAVDPIGPIAELCARRGLWLHVDAAYAGPAAIVPELRPLFAGWERADSIVINPHKWMFTPMCCSVLYTRRPGDLREAFTLVPEYLRSDVGDDRATPEARDEPVDYMNYGIQLGRPFRALRLWMVMCAYGRAGIRARLERQVRMARDLAARIDAHPDFERLAPTPFSTVCFRHRPGAGPGTGDGTALLPVADDAWAPLNERLMAAINTGGEAFLSHTRLRGRLTLRLAVGNLRTRPDDVAATWELLQQEAARLAHPSTTGC